MKKLINTTNLILTLYFLIAAFIASAIELGILPGDFGPVHKYVSNFHGRALLVAGIAVICTYLAIRRHSEFLSKLTLLFLTICFIDSIGNLFGWYAVNEWYGIPWYDNFAHYTDSILITIALYIFFERSANLPIIYTALLSMAIGFAIGTIFGVYEYLSDVYLNTHMVGGVEDAISDNILDFSGSLTGFLLLTMQKKAK